LNIENRKHRIWDTYYESSNIIFLKTILIEKIEGQKRDQIADNIHGSATSGTGARFQILPLYSDIQKRTPLCNKHLYAYIERMML